MMEASCHNNTSTTIPPTTAITSFRLLPCHTARRHGCRLPPLQATGVPSPISVEQPGSKMVVELVGAFTALTQTLNLLSTASSRLLFNTLKFSLPLLHSLPTPASAARPPLSRALSVASLLAHLQMDAEVISVGILRELVQESVITIQQVKQRIGVGTAHLLFESLRVKDIPSKVDVLDVETTNALKKFCLSYYDIRALIVELAVKLDMMRHLDCFPTYMQQQLSLEVLKVYAPLAHAVGTGSLSLELEDLSFRYLFPYSYLHVDTWLKNHEIVTKPLVDVYKDQLLHLLNADASLVKIVDGVSIKSRFKSRFSTMKKLLKDGRRPEEVHDILGLRIILNIKPGDQIVDRGQRACYRTYEVIQSLWKIIPGRTKDYIAKPKRNGYQSLHMVVMVNEDGSSIPMMEIQIRTTEMDRIAVGGTASHSLYKGGLTDPEEAKKLKAIVIAAAELAALRLSDFSSTSHQRDFETEGENRVFNLLDKNGDGRISLEELTEVVEELGAEGEDADELMQLLDANSDGSLSSDEFDQFQRQVECIQNLEDKDYQFKSILTEELQIDSSSTGLFQVYQKELGDKMINR